MHASTCRQDCQPPIFDSQQAQLLPWPAYSPPDMSPIEHEWISLGGVSLVFFILLLRQTNFGCAYKQYGILFRRQILKICLTPCRVVAALIVAHNTQNTNSSLV
ncbi:hypothetical protein TNCV_3799661 [Trichonephila clavipes]|nr:hypothetical protein TNCV_3799661 [Trichonephila clavipes]